ncbi:MAG TPA: hypothetical protein PLU53_06415 [Bacteroidia bacterium]|nr:hypothetical protein [Bacteroidia bacterium]
MRKIKTSQEVNGSPELKVVSLQNDRAQIEFEIDRHVKSIQSLIRKLVPSERQKYYNGLLSHMLAEPVRVPLEVHSNKQVHKDRDYSQLNEKDLGLIRELSQNLEQLYRISGFDTE